MKSKCINFMAIQVTEMFSSNFKLRAICHNMWDLRANIYLESNSDYQFDKFVSICIQHLVTIKFFIWIATTFVQELNLFATLDSLDRQLMNNIWIVTRRIKNLKHQKKIKILTEIHHDKIFEKITNEQ